MSNSLRPHESQHASVHLDTGQHSLSITNSRSSLKLTSIESVMPSSHLILCRPLLLLPPIPPSITVFSNESTLRIRWPKYWSFSFSIIPSKEHPGLISFRKDWLNLLAVQGTLRSLRKYLFPFIKFTAIVLIFLIIWTFILVFSIESQRYYMCRVKILQMILPIFPLNFNIFLLQLYLLPMAESGEIIVVLMENMSSSCI